MSFCGGVGLDIGVWVPVLCRVLLGKSCVLFCSVSFVGIFVFVNRLREYFFV